MTISGREIINVVLTTMKTNHTCSAIYTVLNRLWDTEV